MPRTKMTEEEARIVRGLWCPTCQCDTALVTATDLFGEHAHGTGYLRRCPQCGAYVACHPDSKLAMGRVADASLRKARREAHIAFDALWGKGRPFRSRFTAYAWLSKCLGTPRGLTHIGMFDAVQCRRVVELCNHKAGQLSHREGENAAKSLAEASNEA